MRIQTFVSVLEISNFIIFPTTLIAYRIENKQSMIIFRKKATRRRLQPKERYLIAVCFPLLCLFSCSSHLITSLFALIS